MDIDGQVCFHRWLFAIPVRPLRCTTRSLGQWMALIRMWVVPHCCQRLSRLIPWIESVSVTYWRHSTAAYVLVVALPAFGYPPAPTAYLTPPPPTRGEAIMLVKLSIILFSNSHNFTYYAHRLYLLFSKLFLV